MKDSEITGGPRLSGDGRVDAGRAPKAAGLHPDAEWYFKLFHCNPVAMSLSTAREGRYLEVNAEFLRLMERTREEVIGHTAFEINAWADPDRRAVIIAQIRERGSLHNLELEMRSKSGPIHHVLWSVELVELDGESCLLALALDISERKRAEEALRQSHSLLEAALESTADGILVVDVDQRVSACNRKFLEMWRIPPGLAARRDDRQLLDWVCGQLADPVRFLAQVAEQYQNPAASFQDELFLRDGRVFERYSQPQRLGDTIVGRVWSFRDVTEQRRAETALRESEQRYHQLFDLESDAVILVDCETHRYVDVNLSAQRLYGYSREELLQMTPEMLSDEPEKTRATIGTGSIYVPLRWHRRKNGERFAVEITANQFDYQGRRTELAALRDVTPRQRVMEMLQETTRQLLEAQSIARLGSYQLDFQTGRWTCSVMLDELFGLEDPDFPKDVAGWLRIVHPEDRAAMERYLRDEVMKNRTPFDRQYRIVRQNDRQERWVHGLGRLIPDAQGGLRQMAGIIQDVTERKRVEEANERLVTVVEQAAESIVITDTNGKMLYVNPAFEKISGYTADEALGKNPRILKSGRHGAEFYRQMWALLARGEKWSGRLSNRRKDGTLYEEDATIIAVRNGAGEIVNYTAVKRDVTHEVQLEGQLRQSQKMEAVGQLAGGVAHDFNNILVALLMQIELLEMGGGLPAEVGDGLKQIRTVAGRAAELTRQLLLFSRRQVMQPRPLDLNELVANFARLLQRLIREDVRLVLRLHPAPLMVHADAGMLEQVLMNLAVNARDAMPGGGQLLIETVETTVDETVAGLNPDAALGPHVCISVSDTGGGIPPEILPQIFEPFFTTKEVGKGTGLGLATVFGIVKQHHGWLKVENEPGRGATFRIYLPATATPAPAAVPGANPAKPTGGSETILLAEDELMVRKLVCAILERHGYRVLTAPTGVEALKLWQENRQSVALLLTDLVMPGGLSGLELARQMQAEQPRLKVVFISGYSAEIAGRELQLHGGDNFVQKPFTTEQLLGTLRRSLDG